MTVQAPIDPAVATLNVLVVDNDPAVCAAYDEVLRGAGYEVATATSRDSALSAVDRLDGSIDVLVVDVSLPDVDCTALAWEIVGRIGPRPTLYVTTWESEFVNLSDAPGRWIVMRLPVDVGTFLASIEWLAGRTDTRPGSRR